jgi:hypothetical protein
MMVEQWILDKIEPLKGDPLIILRDPQRMIQAGARVVDGWAEENGYTVLFCAGNLGLREMYENIRDEPGARVLLVDRSRRQAKIPLFYPDLAAMADGRRQIDLSLRDFLVETTRDTHWPELLNGRRLSRLLLANLPDALNAHRQLRAVHPTRFTDDDLHKIALGATLKINPFARPTIGEVRQVYLEQHHALDELQRLLPETVMATVAQAIRQAPRPFCWLLEREPDQVIMAFTLAALMRQHGLEYQVLLSNLDPALHAFKDIPPADLDQAMKDQLMADPDHVLTDVQLAEKFLCAGPETRLAFLLRDRLQLDDPASALAVLQKERLSVLIRSLALISLLADLIENRRLSFHRQVAALLDQQAGLADLPVLRRLTDEWRALENTYRRALAVYTLTDQMAGYAHKLKVATPHDLDFASFDKLWNQDRLNRLDYYLSDLERSLRVGNILPIKFSDFWPELRRRWASARAKFKEVTGIVEAVQNLLDQRFQDFYRLHYADWIRRPDAPVIFTHQFLPRLLKAHWDPQSGQKAVVLIFDGLRPDAWEEFLLPVLKEKYDVVAQRPGSAILPTETQLSRKAISAGCLPEEFVAQSELKLLDHWLQQNMGLKLNFTIDKEDDTVASGMTVRYVSDQLEYIVFNFTDKNLHHNEADLAFIYDHTVSAIIREDVRSVLRELPEDALIFITSDHGFRSVPAQTVTIPAAVVADSYDVKYRNARAQSKLSGRDEKKVIDFDVRRMGIPPTSSTLSGAGINYILFPRPGYSLRRSKGHRPPDRYSHGGLSLAECLVPMVVMGPRPAFRPRLSIEQLNPGGAVTEDEPVTLEIVVVARRQGKVDTTILLEFSGADIPARREIFQGQRAAYTVTWTPHLGEMAPEDRERGEKALSVTVILSYRQEGQNVRLSQTADIRIKLDTTRLRRRLDSKLNFLMGKVPPGLKS